MNFLNFQKAVAAKFATMSKEDKLFRIDVSKDDLWKTYLGSFPAGSDPIFRQRSEHDCNCCKQFIRAVGDVVSIKNGVISSIWDVSIKDEPEYQAVADGMSALLHSGRVARPFYHYENKAGTQKTFESVLGTVSSWDHFFVNIDKKFVLDKKLIDSKISDELGTIQVLTRSLKELSLESVDTTLDLINQNSLYRGKEQEFAIKGFRKLKVEFDKLSLDAQNLFAFENYTSAPAPVTRIRNTAAGTLLTDLSEGMDLEAAVRRWEAVMAPSNYQRPTALVTKKMIEQAKKTIEGLGLTSALERRYATVQDITVDNLLFVDRKTKSAIQGDVFSELATKQTSKKLDKIEEIHIDKFISDVLPTVKSIELLMENSYAGNMVSLVAPADPSSEGLFKWDNKFSWSYTGDMADSIKERVKAAGGNVSGDVCCRLAWYNHDDLDFHLSGPGIHIYFGNRRDYTSEGMLDVDMNAGRGTTRTPVENIFFPNWKKMPKGEYELSVNQFQSRESNDVGFDVEIDILGFVHKFSYDKRQPTDKSVVVAKLNVTANGVEVIPVLGSTQKSKDVWGLKTNEFIPVNAMMLSPNCWGGANIGNKHFFFMLDGCQNEGTARGFFNEFLRAELNPHRKVIEMVGAKMRTDESQNQLSGVGFSSTKKASVVLKVQSAFTRTLKVVF